MSTPGTFAFARELAIAEEIAREAAVLVRGYHGTDLAVDQKAGNEPVTEADRAANTLIVDRLRAAFPDDAILSEELPDLELDDLVYAENIGAYASASATYFNGFPPAKVLHVNRTSADKAARKAG